MGLKTTNYKVQDFNLILPEAYAYIIECHSDRVSGYANIGIFANREDAENPMIYPYEIKRITFKINRDENDRITAYNKAKSEVVVEVQNPVTGEVHETLVKESFFGWQDDILD